MPRRRKADAGLGADPCSSAEHTLRRQEFNA